MKLTKNKVSALVFDLKRAFDVVDHALLIKIKTIGIEGTSNTTICFVMIIIIIIQLPTLHY